MKQHDGAPMSSSSKRKKARQADLDHPVWRLVQATLRIVVAMLLAL
jgi:hypothetical protein